MSVQHTFAQQNQSDPDLRRIRSKFESLCNDCWGIIEGPSKDGPGEEMYYNVVTKKGYHIDCYSDLKKGSINFLTGERTAPRYQMEHEPELDDRQGELTFDPVHASAKDHVVLCEDDDPNCPFCQGACERVPVEKLTRVDNPDRKISFCAHCAIDAKESGKWINEQEDEPIAMIADLRVALDKEMRENNHLKMVTVENAKLKQVNDRLRKSVQLLAIRTQQTQ